jgi:hypothetical protein
MTRKTYIGTKIIEAKPGANPKGDGTQEGYDVWYSNPDGSEYRSWSPKDVFEAAYEPTDGLSFGLAIEALKKGLKVARKGWNGKGMFIYYVPANEYHASGNTPHTMEDLFEDDLVPYQAYIAMKTAQNTVVPWLASQSDMLSTDWEILDVWY